MARPTLEENPLTPEELAIAEKNGISALLAKKRYYSGMEREQAISQPIRRANEERKKWMKVAEANGISYYTFQTRVSTCKWTMEQAATLPLGTQVKGINRSGITPEMLQIAAKNGITRQTVVSRIKTLHWSPEKAITYPVDVTKRRKVK